MAGKTSKKPAEAVKKAPANPPLPNWRQSFAPRRSTFAATPGACGIRNSAANTCSWEPASSKPDVRP